MSWAALLLLLLCVRFVLFFRRRRLPRQTCSVAIFLGSGGHTSEALQLASSLDFSRYTPRTYVVSQGDAFSAQKALALERIKASHTVISDNHSIQPQYKLLTIPRARRVHQSLLTTPPDAVKSLLACVYFISVCPLFKIGAFRRPFADLLILNGPGTCVVLYAAVLLNRLIGLPGPRVMYVESFARVRSLSLSGKLLYHFVDRFVVQWPDLVQSGGREDYRGCLV
ncbi:hypothetical protein AZE42_02977 [Rhizopogon vesiculosus]|uniref:UDP-N-acetylglucosamine transferase subunit ALG14 n=1 Tax=Rhizopogon vesiculosus TaxID=180088 RepID=A0A1J8RGE3_9AGAM|nr:hypothetical protein AZE42_02977 [Rhizopogon vesiculosus]